MAVYENKKLFDVLKELNIIDESKLSQAFGVATESKRAFGDVLQEQELISEENLAKTVSSIISVPYIKLSEVQIPSEILRIVPEVVAKKQRIISFKKDREGLHVAMTDPTDLQMREFLEKKVGLPVIPYLATNHDVADIFSQYTTDFSSAFDEIIATHIADAKHATQEDPPIIKIVETIVTYAYQNRASDIHIEPEKAHAIVRFRIDGILHDIVTLPLELNTQVVTRIKVISHLRTDEHQIPQDGKIQMEVDGEQLDIRVSIVPITTGENIVMRLLTERARQFSLTSLGFDEDDLKKLTEAYGKPYGMVLSTGPTGSGKTTTMYAILKLLNNRGVNIMTIEDPVEYGIEGVNQIQANTKTDLTFATGLRSILRQDPNIILVGEIRDEETADIAVNAAMTGHLVLSTLHTNDAATAIPRLLDMKIEPYLIASTVSLIVGQRLVRKIHTPCRVSDEIDAKDLVKLAGAPFIKKLFGAQKKLRLYHGKGCQLCHGTGYEGRIGIYETLVVTDEVRKAIVSRQDADTIRNAAIKDGMRTMLQDGLEKVKHGMTTIEEILRVTQA